MGVGKRNESWEYLNGEELFKLWSDLGSLSKVRNHLVDHGVVNPATGENPTVQGIRVAARRWMALNPEQSRKAMYELGETWVEDDAEWWMWLVAQARGSLGNEAFEKWIQKYNLHDYLDQVTA